MLVKGARGCGTSPLRHAIVTTYSRDRNECPGPASSNGPRPSRQGRLRLTFLGRVRGRLMSVVGCTPGGAPYGFYPDEMEDPF
jgi:hypothetical protein